MTIGRALDHIANIALIVACAAMVYAVAASPRLSKQPTAAVLKKGDQLDGIRGLEGARTTLAMVLSSQCRFCDASVPFYKALLGSLKSRPLARPRVVVLTRDERAVISDYLHAADIIPDEVITLTPSELQQIRVPGTPSLLVVHNGIVQHVWFGRLTKDKETEVIAALGASNTASSDPQR